MNDRQDALAKKDVKSLYRKLKYATPVLLSAFEEGTIGYYADVIHMRPDAVIEVFERAGIPGLTPKHLLDDESRMRFEQFVRHREVPQATKVYQDDGGIESKIMVVSQFSEEVLKALARSPKLLHQLEPRKFEELVARLLEEQGCEVALTKQTRDGGYDILGRFKSGPVNMLFLAECKRYAPEYKVGIDIVQRLFGVTEANRANLGLVITTSSFTRDAQAEKLRLGPRIDLKEYTDLCDWLSPFRGSD